jgi:hypothetical protein
MLDEHMAPHLKTAGYYEDKIDESPEMKEFKSK